MLNASIQGTGITDRGSVGIRDTGISKKIIVLILLPYSLFPADA